MKLLAITSFAVIAYRVSALASATSEETNPSQLYLNTHGADQDNVPRLRNLRSDVAEMVNPTVLKGLAPNLPQNIRQQSRQKARFSFKKVPLDQQRERPDFLKLLARFQESHTTYDEKKMLAFLLGHYDDAALAKTLVANKKDMETWKLASGLEEQLFAKWNKINPVELFDSLKVSSDPKQESVLFNTWVAFMHRKYSSEEIANGEILKVLSDKNYVFKHATTSPDSKADLFGEWTAIAKMHFEPPVGLTQLERPDFLLKLVTRFQESYKTYDEKKMLAFLSKHYYPDDAVLAKTLVACKKDKETWKLASGLEKQLFAKWNKINPGELFNSLSSDLNHEIPLFNMWVAFVHSQYTHDATANMVILDVLKGSNPVFKRADKSLSLKKEFFDQWTAIAKAHFKPPNNVDGF